jgi:hypothetical protein
MIATSITMEPYFQHSTRVQMRDYCEHGESLEGFPEEARLTRHRRNQPGPHPDHKPTTRTCFDAEDDVYDSVRRSLHQNADTLSFLSGPTSEERE